MVWSREVSEVRLVDNGELGYKFWLCTKLNETTDLNTADADTSPVIGQPDQQCSAPPRPFDASGRSFSTILTFQFTRY